MRISFHPAARLEERAAFAYYNDQQTGLGEQFRQDLAACIRRVASHPEQFPGITEIHRRALLDRFPYQVFFTAGNGRVRILAVAHGKREPLYWLHRI